MRKSALVALLLAFGAFGSSDANAENRVSAVTASEAGGATVVKIAGTSTPTFTVYKLDRPARVVVDVANAEMVAALGRRSAKATFNINSWSISSVTATQRKARGNKLVRVVVRLARSSSYKVKAVGHDLVITVRARAAKPATGASPVELERARKAEAKAKAASRLAAARARQATERAERAAVRAAKHATEVAELRRSNATASAAERSRRERAEAQLAKAMAATERAKSRAKAAEVAMVAARRDSSRAEKAAEQRVARARKEAEQARAEAKRASRAAAAQLARAERDREQAATRLSRADELVKAARSERAAAKRARAAATASERKARTAIAAAERQRNIAAQAAADAASARERADRAVATGSGKAAQLKARAIAAANAADKRRAAAEQAALVAEKRRREAESAASSARKRERASASEVAAAERKRAAADSARLAAEQARAKAEARSVKLMSAIKRAKASAREAEARAETYRVAAAKAEKQADAARTKRLAEEHAFAAAARAKVVAVREREKAERGAAEVKRRVVALKRAELELAGRRADSRAAAVRARSSTDRAERTRMAKIAASKKRELATAARALAARRSELVASERRAAELSRARTSAASELDALKRAAANARAVREREEARAAKLDAKRSKADALYRAAEGKLASAKAASAAAEKARRAAARELDRARAERAEARSERSRLAAARRDAEADKVRATAARDRAKADRAAAAKDRAAAKKLRASALAKAKAARGSTKRRARRTRVNDVKFVDRADVSRVVLGLSAPATPKIIRNDGSSAVLELTGVAIARGLERTLDTSAFSGPVKAVSSFRDPKNPKKVRVVVDLDRVVAGKLKKVGNTYYWDFAKRPAARRATARKGARTRSTSYQPSQVASFGAASSSITQQTVSQLRPRRRRVYRGRRIDLNFKDADIHNLLRILATVGGVNIVVPQTVRGTVTVRLKSVPWDQAMEVILSSQGLWYRRSGSLIRVDKRDVLDKEDKDAAEAAAARVKAEPPVPEIKTLDYSDASKIKTQLSPLLSPKGRIEIDARTNSLIVNDVTLHRRKIIDLADRLDTQTPQIQIEARVVEARTTFAREFGIQWGGNVAATPQGGNATGLIFPNAVQVAGAAEDGATPNAGVAAVPSDFAVNLPAAIGTGSGGGLGISLGSVGGNLNINLRLSALEDSGTVRIISSPKITTSNNINAKIKSGVSIPVSVVSANGTQTQFVPADLSLEVQPSVSQSDCAVSMRVVIKKNEADFANTGARGDPSIITKEAETTILVADGETAVIGGIYTRNTGLNYSKVPFFAEIPVIGYFFKNRSENDERSETLLFITPKITNRAFLRCQ